MASSNLPKHSTATKQGEDWLTLALDPFHDYQVPLAGLPDRTNIPTAVQIIKRKITITAPPNLTGTQKWSCHIFSLPTLTTYQAQASKGDELLEVAEPNVNSSLCNIGTLNVVRAEDGNPTYVQDSFAAWDDTSTVVEAYSPTDGNKSSSMRLVAGGFEVHNDTASLYKDGSVTVYSSPNAFSNPYLVLTGDGAGAEKRLAIARRARYPPVFASDASLYTDARTWAAAQGCYVPLRLDLDQGNHFEPRELSLPVLADRENGVPDSKTGMMIGMGKNLEISNLYDGLGALAGYQTIMVANGNATSEFQSNGWLEASIETTGAFFTGLSQETVLTLDVRWFTEVAPTSANVSMLSMCSPSAHYDPRALECYTNCLLQLPPGVPVAMNAKGDFWKMITKTARSASNVALPLISAMGPEAAIFAAAADTGLRFAEKAVERKANNKKPAPKAASRPAAKSPGANNTHRK